MVGVKAKSSRNRHIESKGKLIVVEGIDGSGKSTQIRLLEKWHIANCCCSATGGFMGLSSNTSILKCPLASQASKSIRNGEYLRITNAF